MAIKRMTYLDIPAELRRDAAKAARENLKSHLRNPFLTPEQAAVVQAKLSHLDAWEGAKLVPAGSPPAKARKHHDVAVSEKLSVAVAMGPKKK